MGIALILLLYLSGSPLAVAFGLGASVVALGAVGVPINNLSELFFSTVDAYPLIAAPFFILAGYLLTESGGMEPVRDLMHAWFGHIQGGYALAGLVFATFLGSISGSSAACLAILASVVLPVMVESGYDRPFSAALATVGGELGLIIPPSIYLVIFGAQNHVSIAELFLGGVGPGLLMAALFALVVMRRSKQRKYPKGAAPATWKVRLNSLVKSLPTLFMPVIILGGIYGGIFTPTQAAAIATFYILALGLVYYRKLTWSGIVTSLVATVKVTSMIYLLVISAALFGKMLAYLMIPQNIARAVVLLQLNAFSFLLAVEAVLFAVGFFFSSLPMIIVLLPAFMPAVNFLGIDPVFFGVIGVIMEVLSKSV